MGMFTPYRYESHETHSKVREHEISTSDIDKVLLISSAEGASRGTL